MWAGLQSRYARIQTYMVHTARPVPYYFMFCPFFQTLFSFLWCTCFNNALLLILLVDELKIICHADGQ